MTDTNTPHQSGPRRRRAVFDHDRARQLHDLGWSMRDIGLELGVGTMTVQRLLKTYTPPQPLLVGVPGLADAGASEESKPGLAPQPAPREVES